MLTFSMPTKKLTRFQQQLITQLNSDLSNLQNDPTCMPDTIVSWVTAKTNSACKVLTGRAGRKLGNPIMQYCSVEDIDEKPRLKLGFSWVYKTANGDAPPAEELAKLIKAFDFNTSPDFEVGNAFNAELNFDLDVWKNLVPSILAVYVYNALDRSESVRDDVREASATFAQKLLARYYPAVDYAFLEVAFEIGVLDASTQDFVAWFNNHVEAKTDSAIQLPDSLTLAI